MPQVAYPDAGECKDCAQDDVCLNVSPHGVNGRFEFRMAETQARSYKDDRNRQEFDPISACVEHGHCVYAKAYKRICAAYDEVSLGVNI